MVNVSKVFVALLVCFMTKECIVCADSASSASDSDGVPDAQCDRGFVLCKISGGDIGCVEICTNNTSSKCEHVDVNNSYFCFLVNVCTLPNTLEVEATETSLAVNCNFSAGGELCRIVCLGGCAESMMSCSSSTIFSTIVPTCTGCIEPTCVPVCTPPE